MNNTIDWKRKVTSRKFWAAIALFVSGCIVAFTGHKETAETVSGLIMQGAAVVAYIIGEGLADAANVPVQVIEAEKTENSISGT